MISFLSLGSNLGDRENNLLRAINLIGERVGKVLKISSFIETEPWGFTSDNAFLNACVKVDTNLMPQQLLTETQKIERLIGRTQKTTDGKYCDRLIDIDILLYGNITVDEENLKIPHPQMYKRDFVMVPLKEIM
jgi:2-amino-4-hydroxy-6-hydroxymethyldihydropteridine diphosphokinase